MAEKTKFTDVNKYGEFGLIDHLTKSFSTKRSSTLYGIGDDAAVINTDGDNVTVVSTDSLVEGIHFDPVYSPMRYLGYKSVVVNLSDICAMNIAPSQLLFSIALSSKYSVEALEEIYAGISDACALYNVDLIGGDTTSSTRGLFINATALGLGNKKQVTYRSGAKEGDIICVTGNLGASYLGLQILEREKMVFMEHPEAQPDFDKEQYLIQRQLKPEARLDMIKTFAEADFLPTSMIDISDGLGSEVLHICKNSKVGAIIEEAKVPIKQEVELKAIDFKLDPITVALSGGEDYELLFTADPKDLDIIRNLPDVSIIGEILPEEQEASLYTSGGNIHKIIAQGWNHFEE